MPILNHRLAPPNRSRILILDQTGTWSICLELRRMCRILSWQSPEIKQYIVTVSLYVRSPASHAVAASFSKYNLLYLYKA